MKQLTQECMDCVPIQSYNNLTRVLRYDDPCRPYTQIPTKQRSVNHWGQRKLLISEIEFLTINSQPGMLVVYAGAAYSIPNRPLFFILIDNSSLSLGQENTFHTWPTSFLNWSSSYSIQSLSYFTRRKIHRQT